MLKVTPAEFIKFVEDRKLLPDSFIFLSKPTPYIFQFVRNYPLENYPTKVMAKVEVLNEPELKALLKFKKILSKKLDNLYWIRGEEWV